MLENKEQSSSVEVDASLKDVSTPQPEPDSLISKIRERVEKKNTGSPKEITDVQLVQERERACEPEPSPTLPTPQNALEEFEVRREGLIELSLPPQREDLIGGKEAGGQGVFRAKETTTLQKERGPERRESLEALVLSMMRMIVRSFRALLFRLIGGKVVSGRGTSQEGLEAASEFQSLQSRIEVVSSPRDKKKKRKKEAKIEEAPKYKLRAQVSVGESVGELRLDKVDDEE